MAKTRCKIASCVKRLRFSSFLENGRSEIILAPRHSSPFLPTHHLDIRDEIVIFGCGTKRARNRGTRIRRTNVQANHSYHSCVSRSLGLGGHSAYFKFCTIRCAIQLQEEIRCQLLENQLKSGPTGTLHCCQSCGNDVCALSKEKNLTFDKCYLSEHTFSAMSEESFFLEITTCAVARLAH